MEGWHPRPPAVCLGPEPGFNLPLTPQSGDEDAMPTMLHLGNPGSHDSPSPRHPRQEGATINEHARSLGIVTAAVVGILALALPARLQAGEPSTLAEDMIGTWVLVGTPDKVGEPPAAGGRLKFRTGRHWQITHADPATGKVIFHHGGTYTLDGDDYAETVEYANESTAGLIKRTFKFKVKVDGDTYTQIGVGNPYTEVWKRVK